MNGASDGYAMTAIRDYLVENSLIAATDRIGVETLSSTGRVPAASTKRHTVSVNGVSRFSVKEYPVDGLFRIDRIIAAQSHIGRACGFKVPRIYGSIDTNAAVMIVEGHIPRARSLKHLHDHGVINSSEAKRIHAFVLKEILDLNARGQEAERDVSDVINEVSELNMILSLADLDAQTKSSLVSRLSNELTHGCALAQWVHGDVTPGNILRAPSEDGGPDWQWWLVDFDLAHKTTLPWIEALRAGHYAPWGLPYWRRTWGNEPLREHLAVFALREREIQRLHTGRGDDDKSLFDVLMSNQGSGRMLYYAEIFYSNENQEFSQDRTVGRAFKVDFDRIIRMQFDVPGGATRLRIDPINHSCAMQILEISVRPDSLSDVDEPILIPWQHVQLESSGRSFTTDGALLIISIEDDVRILLKHPFIATGLVRKIEIFFKIICIDRRAVSILAEASACSPRPNEEPINLVQEAKLPLIADLLRSLEENREILISHREMMISAVDELKEGDRLNYNAVRNEIVDHIRQINEQRTAHLISLIDGLRSNTERGIGTLQALHEANSRAIAVLRDDARFVLSAVRESRKERANEVQELRNKIRALFAIQENSHTTVMTAIAESRQQMDILLSEIRSSRYFSRLIAWLTRRMRGIKWMN